MIFQGHKAIGKPHVSGGRTKAISYLVKHQRLVSLKMMVLFQMTISLCGFSQTPAGPKEVAQHRTESLKQCRKEAESGNVQAMLKLSHAYACGKGIACDMAESGKWIRKAAEAGNATALGILNAYLKGDAHDYPEALKCLRKAAEAGDGIAMSELGALYVRGLGVEQDFTEAKKWFLKSIDSGSDAAFVSLGLLYQNGDGVPKDYKEAMKWYQKAADAGYATALNAIGLMYLNGDGVPKDNGEALKWLKKAAEAGFDGALINIGIVYDISFDTRSAIENCKKAAASSDPNVKKWGEEKLKKLTPLMQSLSGRNFERESLQSPEPVLPPMVRSWMV